MAVPAALVRAYIRMMPRLEAEETLDQINVEALGNGQVEQQYRMRAIDGLKRKALGERFRVKKATRAGLAGMGIGVRITAASEGPEEALSDG